MQGRGKAGGLSNSIGSEEDYYVNQKRGGAILRVTYDPRMSDGAKATFVTGKLGVFRMYVNSLDDADECNQENTSQRQNFLNRSAVRAVSHTNQTKYPGELIKPHPCSEGECYLWIRLMRVMARQVVRCAILTAQTTP